MLVEYRSPQGFFTKDTSFRGGDVVGRFVGGLQVSAFSAPSPPVPSRLEPPSPAFWILSRVAPQKGGAGELQHCQRGRGKGGGRFL